jgi:hypothetical protein
VPLVHFVQAFTEAAFRHDHFNAVREVALTGSRAVFVAGHKSECTIRGPGGSDRGSVENWVRHRLSSLSALNQATATPLSHHKIGKENEMANPATEKRGGNPDVKHKPEDQKPKGAMERKLEQGLEVTGSDPVSVTQPPKTEHHEK